MALTLSQQAAVVNLWTQVSFVQAGLTANFTTADVLAAAQSIDNAFDATLSQAVAAVGGATTVINGLASAIPSPFSGASASQKTLLACYVLMKRAGII